MLDTPSSEVVWRVLSTHSFRQFPFHFPSDVSPCAITFQLDSVTFTAYLNLHDLVLFWKSIIPRFSYCGRHDFTPTTKHMKLKSRTFRTQTTHYNNFSKYTSRSRHILLQSSLTQRSGHTICLNVLRLHFAHTVCKQLLLTYLLTPWCRVLLEKLTGLQLVKKFPAFHGTRRFITALTSVGLLSLSWASPIQSIYPHPTSWRSNLILSTRLRLGLPSSLFPSGFPTKTLYTPLSSPIRATCPAHLIFLDFITRTILGEEYKSLSSSLCSLLHSPVTSSLLGPNILLNAIFSNTLSFLSL